MYTLPFGPTAIELDEPAAPNARGAFDAPAGKTSMF